MKLEFDNWVTIVININIYGSLNFRLRDEFVNSVIGIYSGWVQKVDEHANKPFIDPKKTSFPDTARFLDNPLITDNCTFNSIGLTT